jgi:hypothetical protein
MKRILIVFAAVSCVNMLAGIVTEAISLIKEFFKEK